MGNCFLYKRGFGGGFGGGGGGGEDVPVVEKTASGKVILLTDSAEKPLSGLRLFGKTTQSGTPSPDAPIPLVIAGDGGSIAVKIGTSESDANAQTLTVSTPNGLPGVPVSTDGNYTDENGWQWICDEVDFARGVYVQRVMKVIYDGSSDENWSVHGNTRAKLDLRGIVFPQATNVLPGCLCDHYERKSANNTYDGLIGISIQGWGDGAGGIFIRYGDTADLQVWKSMLAESPITCLFALATPIETPLTSQELSQYAALHTYDPGTTIYNDAGSHMEVKYMAKGG